MLMYCPIEMTFGEVKPGDWETIEDFRLPVEEENRSVIGYLAAEIAERLIELKENWNFDFGFDGDGILLARERDAREDITRISLSVRRIHDTIRNLLAEVAPEFVPPLRYQSVPYSDAPMFLGSKYRNLVKSPSFSPRFAAIAKHGFPHQEVGPATVEMTTSRNEYTVRLLQFFDRSDQLCQFRGLSNWLEALRRCGQLVTFVEVAKEGWLERKHRRQKARTLH